MIIIICRNCADGWHETCSGAERSNTWCDCQHRAQGTALPKEPREPNPAFIEAAIEAKQAKTVYPNVDAMFEDLATQEARASVNLDRDQTHTVE